MGGLTNSSPNGGKVVVRYMQIYSVLKESPAPLSFKKLSDSSQAIFLVLLKKNFFLTQGKLFLGHLVPTVNLISIPLF